LAAANYMKKAMGMQKVDVAVVFGSGHKGLADEVDNP
jgi:purine nucleoside phosphorylase